MNIRSVEIGSAITDRSEIAATRIRQMGSGTTRQASTKDAEVNHEKIMQIKAEPDRKYEHQPKAFHLWRLW